MKNFPIKKNNKNRLFFDGKNNTITLLFFTRAHAREKTPTAPVIVPPKKNFSMVNGQERAAICINAFLLCKATEA